MELTAYILEEGMPMQIVPAPKRRQWTDDIKGIVACLPLTIGNQSGWWLLNPVGFSVMYRYGGTHRDDMYIEFDEDTEPYTPHVGSHFGYGVLSVLIPYIFRTELGWNLLIRGPSNYFKEGIHPFEGIVETDWHEHTATMNWKLEGDRMIRFEKDEPLAQIVPIQRGSLEGFDPGIKEMTPDAKEELQEWSERRTDSNIAYVEEGKVKYERSYARRPETQKKLELKEFKPG